MLTHLQLTLPETMERCKFHSCTRRQEESVAAYVVEETASHRNASSRTQTVTTLKNKGHIAKVGCSKASDLQRKDHQEQVSHCK